MKNNRIYIIFEFKLLWLFINFHKALPNQPVMKAIGINEICVTKFRITIFHLLRRIFRCCCFLSIQLSLLNAKRLQFPIKKCVFLEMIILLDMDTILLFDLLVTEHRLETQSQFVTIFAVTVFFLSFSPFVFTNSLIGYGLFNPLFTLHITCDIRCQTSLQVGF